MTRVTWTISSTDLEGGLCGPLFQQTSSGYFAGLYFSRPGLGNSGGGEGGKGEKGEVGGGGQEGEGDKASTSRDSRLDCVEGGGSWDAKFEELALFQAEHGHDLVPKQGAGDTLQHTAAHCSALQHTAAHCNTLQRTATHCSTLQHNAARYITLQHTEHGNDGVCKQGAHCTTVHCKRLQHVATTLNMGMILSLN